MNYNQHYQKFLELLFQQDFDIHSMDLKGVERQIYFLKQLAFVENSSVAVLDIYRQKYILMQSKFLEALGVNMDEVMLKGQQLFYSRMHPDDISFVFDTLCLAIEFLLLVPPEERKNYKIIYDFRLKDNNGEYIRFIQQLLPLELDSRGNIWLMLMINDIVPGQNNFIKQQRRLVHIGTGKLFLFNDQEDLKSKSILSKREIEILELLAKGMASKNVADELSLSINTINNHRRRILEKTNTDSTAAAVRFAISLGLM